MAIPTTFARNGAWWCGVRTQAVLPSHCPVLEQAQTSFLFFIPTSGGSGASAAPLGPACPLHHLEETRRMAGRGFAGFAGFRLAPGPCQAPSTVAIPGRYLFLSIIIHILPLCFPNLQPRLLMRELWDHWIGCGYSISRLGLKKSSWVLPYGDNDYQPRGSFLLRGH